MSPSLINRYLAREVLVPTAICLVIFTLVLVAGRLVPLADLVIGKGVAVGDILRLLGTSLPPLLVIIIPLSFLMGIMLGLGRLSADGEIVALKAGGIGLAAMARPVLLLAALCSVLTLVASVWLTPWAKREFLATLFDITSKQVGIGLQPQVFFKQFKDLVIYAEALDARSGELEGVFIVEQQEGVPLLFFAERGILHSNPQEQSVTLQLRNGSIHRQRSSEDIYQVIGFSTYEISPSTAELSAAPKRKGPKPGEVATAELWELAGGDSGAARQARGELHGRLSAPLAPLLFALLALPFSTFSQRSGRGGGFVIGLLIYLGYYLLTSLAKILTVEVSLHPLLGCWLPHLLCFAAAAWLLRQSALERPAPLLAWSEQCIRALHKLKARHAHS